MIVEFITERLDEDEARARSAMVFNTGTWTTTSSGVLDLDSTMPDTIAEGVVLTNDDAAVGEHMAAWNPKRVLAEVAAKRAIVAEWRRNEENPAKFWDDREYSGHQNGLETALRIMAAVYADHPDYRQEWRP